MSGLSLKETDPLLQIYEAQAIIIEKNQKLREQNAEIERLRQEVETLRMPNPNRNQQEDLAQRGNMLEEDAPTLTTLKILIIGESGVGKTSLMLRFVDDTFNPNQPDTIGVEFKDTTMNIDSNRVKLSIWDTAGQEKFRALMPSYYRGAQGAICVYDVTNRESFEKLEYWVKELDKYSTRGETIKMVVANKIDMPNRQVPREEGVKFAKKHRTLFIEASAKTKEGVQSVFEELIERVIQTPSLWKNNQPSIILTPPTPDDDEQKKRCHC